MHAGNMFAISESPLSISPEQLDDYLARGWFRMNQTIFTTHFLQFNNIFYSAIWLRIDIARYVPDKNHRLALKGIKAFRTEVQPAQITREHEVLYEKYKAGVAFESYSSLRQLLLANNTYSIYNTLQVNIYAGEDLIASGFFDTGKTSAQGIVCIYNPAFKKYSLGKCLIYTKIDYCRQNKLLYFYPGYTVPGYPAFDYKLQIGTQNMQYYNRSANMWAAFTTVHNMYKPLTDMYEKLFELKTSLLSKKVSAKVLYYRFFDAPLSITLWTNLLDYPVFLLPEIRQTTDITRIAVYNIAARQYIYFECIPVYTVENPDNQSTVFSSEVISIYKQLFATTNTDDMANAIIISCNEPPMYIAE